jgi:hypothetical protein
MQGDGGTKPVGGDDMTSSVGRSGILELLVDEL